MNRYYTLIANEGVILVWQPGQAPVMWNNPEQIAGDTATLEMYFMSNFETMIYVPFEVVRILTQ